MDAVMKRFVDNESEAVDRLAASSDILTVAARRDEGSREFHVRFSSPTLVYEGGDVRRWHGYHVALRLTADYLRIVEQPLLVATIEAPHHVWHPNVHGPFICLGNIAPGTGLVELLYRIYAILSYQKLTPHEANALNPTACAWARAHLSWFPLTVAPLRRPLIPFETAQVIAENPS